MKAISKTLKRGTRSQGVDDAAKVVSVVYSDGEKEQESNFVRAGYVEAKYSNGDRYKGFVDELPNGKGFVKAVKGKYTWASGAYYEGQYQMDVKHGKGRYVSASGDAFEGEFNGGKKEGPGRYKYVNGDVLTGTWKKGKREGLVEYVYADGATETSQWKDGKQIASSVKKIAAPLKVNGPGLIIAGAPASGKGTQCKNLKDELGVVHLSTGDMLRAAKAAGTPVGKKAALYMEKGLLVPDEVIVSLIEERLNQDDVRDRGFLLDGFPRTKEQAEKLSSMGVKIDKFILLNVPDEILVERVEGRRTNPETGETYHIKFNPPPKELEGKLTHRADDTAEKVKVRLKEYHGNIASVRQHYEEQVAEVDGNMHPAEVWGQIQTVIKEIEDTTGAPLGIIISGAPASGKGTQCEYLKDKHGVVHLSTGDMLRAAVAEGTEAGKRAGAFMNRGELVPDDVVIAIIKDRLQQDDVKKKGYLLDGFPRTFEQAKALQDMGVEVDLFVLLNVPDDKIVERVTGRRIDPITKKCLSHRL